MSEHISGPGILWRQIKEPLITSGVLQLYFRYKTDGLNSLSYTLKGRRLAPLFTLLNVRLNRSENSIQSELLADKNAEAKVPKTYKEK